MKMSQSVALGLKNSKRLARYSDVTGMPQSMFVDATGRINGVWIMGNNYRRASKDLYGSYPHGYLKRMRALFEKECENPKQVLHLFAGGIDEYKGVIPGTTLDERFEVSPTYRGKAEILLRQRRVLKDKRIVFADPPYSVEDAEHYQTTMVKRNLIMTLLSAGLCRGAFVVWLDQVLPMYRKTDFRIIGVIGMMKSTNHRFRVVTIFEKV